MQKVSGEPESDLFIIMSVILKYNCSAPHTSFALLNRLWAQYSRQTVQVRDFSILSSEFVKSSECLDGRKLVELQPIH